MDVKKKAKNDYIMGKDRTKRETNKAFGRKMNGDPNRNKKIVLEGSEKN